MFFLLLGSFSNAQVENPSSCQYKVNSSHATIPNVYAKDSNTFITNTIEIDDFFVTQMDGGCSQYGTYTVYNNFDYPLTLRLVFDYGYWYPYRNLFKRDTYDNVVNVPPRNFTKVQVGPSSVICSGLVFYNETIKYFFLENNQTFVKYEKVGDCRLCNGATCLNDGAACSIDSQCGSGQCVKGKCSQTASEDGGFWTALICGLFMVLLLFVAIFLFSRIRNHPASNLNHLQPTNLSFAHLTGKPIYINKQGYPCFANGGLLHRYIAEKNIYNRYPNFFRSRYPQIKYFTDFEVHHIDTDKLNSNPNNLIVILKSEHALIEHKRIPSGDRSRGIAELKRLGFTSPHLSELR